MMTLGKLNSKIWYRLLKVVYVGIFLFISLCITVISHTYLTNTSITKLEVQKKVQIKQESKKTQDTFIENTMSTMELNDMTYDEAFVDTLQEYKRRGYSIEGVNIDQELSIMGVQAPNQTNITEDKNKSLISGGLAFGLDTSVIQQQSNLTKAEFFSKLNTLQKNNPSASPEEIYVLGLKLSKQKGYMIEGVDIDQELNQIGVQLPKELDVVGLSIFHKILIIIQVMLLLCINYLIFFQILNRIFYYIVIGTLFPKKD